MKCSMPTFLRTVACLLLLASPAAAQTATDEFNRDMRNVWSTLRPGLQRVIEGEVRNQLVGLSKTSGALTVSVRNYRGMRFSVQSAPGLSQLGPDRVGFRVPETGSWGFEIEATVKAKLRLGFLRPSFSIPIKLKVDRIKMESMATFDVTTDPLRPTFAQVGSPAIDFRVRLRSRRRFTNALLSLLSPLANRLVHRLLNDALTGALPTLAGLQGFPGPVPADGAPPLVDSGVATPFEDVARNVDAKILANHLPQGTIHNTRMDVADMSSWLDAYRNGGLGNAGRVTSHASAGDSAIWTGHFLAAQAFRYASSNSDPVALAGVKKSLAGIGKLFEVNGDTGLLARDAAPTSSQIGQGIAGQNYPYSQRRMINGVEWIGRTGRHGISRDQYSGVVFGLSITYDLVPDPAIRAEIARLNRMILDYLIPRDWIITEDRHPLDAGGGMRGPVFWLGIVNQKLQYLLDGIRMNPGNGYDAELNRAAPMVEFAWIQAWGATLGLDHYYKYNLSNSSYYNYFRLETDSARWHTMNRAYRIMRRYIGHHRNVHFDLIHTTIDPSAKTVLFPASREAFRQFLGRRHRNIAPPVVDLSNVVWQTFTLAGYTNPSVGAGSVAASAATTTVQLPSEPLNFQQRKYTRNFHWQRSPLDAATPNAGDPKYEKSGIDVVVPYWLGKFVGAF
jgi:hypothetical protein